MEIRVKDLNNKKIIENNILNQKTVVIKIDMELYGKIRLDADDKKISMDLLVKNILQEKYGLEKTVRISKRFLEIRNEKPVMKYNLP